MPGQASSPIAARPRERLGEDADLCNGVIVSGAMVCSPATRKLSSSARFWTIWALALMLMGLVLVLAAPYDLLLTLQVADPGATLGRLVARYGEWPGILTAVSALVVWVFARRCPLWRARMPLAAAVVSLTLLHPLALTQLLKIFWGRLRPDALGPWAGRYRPFYRPGGIGRGRSFPSGHVAISAIFVVFPFDLHFRGRHALALAVWPLALGYPLLVAAGRVLAGRHFLCDTIFSVEAALLLAPVLLRLFYHRGLAAHRARRDH